MTEAKPKRRWFRFSLRTLFAFTLLVAIGCGWFAFKLQQARQQQLVSDAIHALGGSVAYDFDYHPWEYNRRPDWLISILGTDFFHDVATVKINTVTFSDTDSERLLVQLKRLPKLAQLDLSQTQVTDSTLVHLDELGHLEYLGLGQTSITDRGLDFLKNLPRLGTVYLAGAQITDASLEHLKTIPHLKWLALVDTQVTNGGILDLQKAKFLQVKVTTKGVTKLFAP